MAALGGCRAAAAASAAVGTAAAGGFVSPDEAGGQGCHSRGVKLRENAIEHQLSGNQLVAGSDLGGDAALELHHAVVVRIPQLAEHPAASFELDTQDELRRGRRLLLRHLRAAVQAVHPGQGSQQGGQVGGCCQRVGGHSRLESLNAALQLPELGALHLHVRLRLQQRHAGREAAQHLTQRGCHRGAGLYRAQVLGQPQPQLRQAVQLLQEHLHHVRRPSLGCGRQDAEPGAGAGLGDSRACNAIVTICCAEQHIHRVLRLGAVAADTLKVHDDAPGGVRLRIRDAGW